MKPFTASACGVVLAAALLMTPFVPAARAASSELPVTVGHTGMEIGDRLRLRGKIMRVDAGKQTLLISEKEVHLLEHYPEALNLRTRLLDEEGKPADFGMFKEGDTVLVLGYRDSEDGKVYAAKIQRVDPNAAAPEPAGNHTSQMQRTKGQKRNPAQTQQQ